ncbi:MAG: DUF1232 domain-containing protein [Atopobiaceae bacterium]|nr:DUF1232 domain-containing protein [Atopobiaceae bacterium]
MANNTNLSNRTKGIITLIVIALYLIIPADAVPDAMIGLGQIDDIIVFAVGVISMLARLKAPASGTVSEAE